MELARPGDACAFPYCKHDFTGHPKVVGGLDVVTWPCTVEGCKCRDFGVEVEVVDDE